MNSTHTDSLGWRAKFGVLGPSTNTIVQPEFDSMRPRGVTNHFSRIFTPDAKAVSNETFMAGSLKIGEGVIDAVKSVMTCEPDRLVMGMSAITFYGGKSGARSFREGVESVSGLGVSIGSESLAEALRMYPGIRSVGVLSPYFPIANSEVRCFLNDSGFTVLEDICLRCPSWTAIAKVPGEVLRAQCSSLAASNADAIVQVGTNLSMAALAPAIEASIGRPVIAVNTATYWHALRTHGIHDKMGGFGRLLEEF